MKRLPILMIITATVLLSCEAKNPKVSQTSTEQPSADSSATAESSAVQPTQEAGEITEGTQANAGQKPALNPPHGEPYHRCDIEVGAPIDSPAPAQNVAPPVVAGPQTTGFNTNPIQPSAPAPAPSVSSSAAVGPKPALNPPHGEPHHRCDLQVGAPLT